MRGEDVIRSHLVEHVAPERPPGTTPDSIFEVVPEVRARLAALAAAAGPQRAAQEEQEALERSR